MKKQILLAILTVISAFLSFYFLKIGLDKIYFLIPGLLILPIIWGISAFLIKNALIILVTSLVVVAVFLFSFGLSLPYLICATLILFSLIWGFKKVQKEKRLRIKILIEEIVPKAVGWLVFVIAIVLAVGFYFSPKVQALKEGIKIPTWVSEKVLKTAVPGFSQDLTVDEMINLLIKKEKNEPLTPQIREGVLKQLGMEDLKLKGKEKISQKPEILERLVTSRINQISKGLADYLPLIVAFVIWQALVWLNKILIPFVVFLDLIIYSILRASGFVKIEKVSVEKEEIVL